MLSQTNKKYWFKIIYSQRYYSTIYLFMNKQEKQTNKQTYKQTYRAYLENSIVEITYSLSALNLN